MGGRIDVLRHGKRPVPKQQKEGNAGFWSSPSSFRPIFTDRLSSAMIVRGAFDGEEITSSQADRVELESVVGLRA